MIEIIIALILWTCDFIPLWVKIVCTVLLSVRFAFRCSITFGKIAKQGGEE